MLGVPVAAQFQELNDVRSFLDHRMPALTINAAEMQLARPKKSNSSTTTHVASSRTKRLRASCVALLALLAACSRSPEVPVTDGQKIVQETLRLLTSDGIPICVDNRTKGASLAIYAAMQVAPSPSRRPLVWHRPAILRPSDDLSNVELLRDSMGSETAHLRDPMTSTVTLPWAAQHRLDAAAILLEHDSSNKTVTISPAWAPGVKARWWPINRLSRNCSPTYTFSNPTWSATTGFITVMTGHSGTIYAFDRGPGGWQPAGQWTNWLY